MAALFIVIPMSHEREELVSWLHSFHLACPPGEGRYPTLEELRLVLDHLDGYTIRYGTGASNWYADVSQTDQRPNDATRVSIQRPWISEWRPVDSDRASIVVNNYNHNETDAHEFYFERGSPRVMLLILQRLARLCGPLILIPDTGDLPVVVTADLKLAQALQEWDI